MPASKNQGPKRGRSRSAPPKQKSGAQKRKERALREAELRKAQPLPLDLPPPPADGLELQLWGARAAALLAYKVLTAPSELSREQLSQAQRYLATLGLLFPRAELVRQLKAELGRRRGQAAEKELKSLAGVDPGPLSRLGGGGRGGGEPPS